MFENMAEQMIQKKQLRSNKSFEEELDMEKRKDDISRGNEVTKKSSKLDVQATKTKKISTLGATNESVSKKSNRIVAEVHNERNDTENANDSQIMTILSTILENKKEQDEKIGSLSNKITNMENELQESQYDYDFECYDDDQTYDENSNVQRVENNVENSDNMSVKRKCDQIETETVQGNQSRFSNMSKRFKSRVICDVKIDETLASNITDLFRNGMNEEQYSDLIKA